jgi:Putative zinc-finger
MTLLTCATVRRRLPAFYDRELPIPELIEIESHVTDCPPCASELKSLRGIGTMLREASAPGPADDWTGLQSGVIGRMRAEAHESWAARAGRMFDDMHLVWIGLAAAVATIVCGSVALSVVHFASPEREDSLASMIEVISAPSGSDLNPVSYDKFLQVPTVPERGAIEFMLAQPMTREEVVLALNAVVTQDGRVSGLSVLSTETHPREMSPILRVLSNARFEPGRMGASPVAVNLVWLLAHTTVKAKAPRII